MPGRIVQLGNCEFSWKLRYAISVTWEVCWHYHGILRNLFVCLCVCSMYVHLEYTLRPAEQFFECDVTVQTCLRTFDSGTYNKFLL
jgi:hypothetical protein